MIEYKNKKVAITGYRGYIGSVLYNRLKKYNCDVTCVDIDLSKSNNDRESSLVIAIASFHLANIAFQQREFDTSSQYLDRSLEIAPTYQKAKNLKAKLSRN